MIPRDKGAIVPYEDNNHSPSFRVKFKLLKAF
jgi:hypothetical protein